MTLASFDPGDKIFFERVFTKAAGQSGTPTSVTVTLAVVDATDTAFTPAPTVTTVVTNGEATAKASLTIPATNVSAGMWSARWVCSGDIIAVEEEMFFVRHSEVLSP